MIVLASDHAGYLLKEEIKTFFNKENIIAIDVGCYSREQLDDYPDFAKGWATKKCWKILEMLEYIFVALVLECLSLQTEIQKFGRLFVMTHLLLHLLVPTMMQMSFALRGRSISPRKAIKHRQSLFDN